MSCRDLGDRVPEVREPASNVPAEEIRDRADHDDDGSADEHAPPLEAPRRRGRLGRRGDAHRLPTHRTTPYRHRSTSSATASVLAAKVTPHPLRAEAEKISSCSEASS